MKNIMIDSMMIDSMIMLWMVVSTIYSYWIKCIAANQIDLVFWLFIYLYFSFFDVKHIPVELS